ncbi:MAG: type III-B CRISPR module RAMP protein Cmr6 [bacterium]
MNANDFQLTAELKEIVFRLNSVENRYLYFNRYSPFNANNKETVKSEVFRRVAVSCREEDRLLAAINKRLVAGGKELQETNEYVVTLTLETAAPLIHGLGGKGVYEVGFTFHPIYGTPYIPGSSLKGIAAAFAQAYHCSRRKTEGSFHLVDNSGEYAASPLEKLGEKLDQIFGIQDSGGVVDFHDAFPEAGVQLNTDIMTPHYPGYYQQNEPPADDQHPKPIPFLAVPQETSFTFRVSGQKRHAAQVDQAAEYLHGGLQELGAGAKSAAGYGYFREA